MSRFAYLVGALDKKTGRLVGVGLFSEECPTMSLGVVDLTNLINDTAPVTRTYRYLLQPSRSQERTLVAWLRHTRELYNAALQERRDAWRKQRISVSYIDQQAQIPAVREERGDLAQVPVVVLRGVLRRLDKAFQGFFRRCKSGDEKPGFPRFKSADRWDTLEFYETPPKSPVVAGGKRLAVRLLGKVKLKMHRPVDGRVRMMKLSRDAAGRWFVLLSCDDVPKKELAPTGTSVGVDLGLTHFAATSDEEIFDNPRPLVTARLKLERASRRVSRRLRGSKRRRRAVCLLARCHERVGNVRREHHIVVAKSLVKSYDTIVVEDLNVKGLAMSALAKSVNDAAWGNFLHWLDCKAEEAGRTVIRVDPRYTSQTCSACGVVETKTLAERVHSCSCGLTLDRDVNAARNILGLGTSLRGAASSVRERRRSAKIHSAASWSR